MTITSLKDLKPLKVDPLSEDQVIKGRNAFERLENHLTFPEIATPKDILADFICLEEYLKNDSSFGKLLYHRFIRHLNPKLDPVDQIRILKQSATIYPFLSKEGTFSFEAIWLLTTALKLSKYNEDVCEKLTEMENELLTHPSVRSLQIEAVKELLSPLHKILITSEVEIREEIERYLKISDQWIKQGKFGIVREMYYEMMKILRTTPSLEKNWDLRGAYLKVIQERCNPLPTVWQARCSNWRAFHNTYQKIKRESSSSEMFSRNKIELLKDISEHCQNMLAPLAPCSFEKLIMGSLTRDEGTFLSDDDCAFLISDESKRLDFVTKFLPAYLAQERFYLGCLDDVWMVDSIDRNHFPIKRIGCDIDEGDLEHLIGTRELILFPFNQNGLVLKVSLVNTPKKMANWITKTFYHYEKENISLPLPFGLLHVQTLSRSNQELFSIYQRELQAWWRDSEQRVEVCTRFIQAHVHDYSFSALSNPSHELSKDGYVINLKKGWLHPFMLWCFDLAFYCEFSEERTVEGILKSLELRLPAAFHSEMTKAWKELIKIRWNCQRQLENVPDRGDPNELFIRRPPIHQYNSADRINLPFFDNYEYLTMIKEALLDPAYALLDKIKTSRVLPDPFISLCEKKLSNLKRPMTEFNGLLEIRHLLHHLNMPVKGICALENISLRPEKLNYPLPDSLIKWLFEDFQRTDRNDRVAWFLQLLKIPALFHWFNPLSLNKILQDLLHVKTQDQENLFQKLNQLHAQVQITLSSSLQVDLQGIKYTDFSSHQFNLKAGLSVFGKCEALGCKKNEGEWIYCGNQGTISIRMILDTIKCSACAHNFAEFEKIALSECQCSMNAKIAETPKITKDFKIPKTCTQIIEFSSPLNYLNFDFTRNNP